LTGGSLVLRNARRLGVEGRFDVAIAGGRVSAVEPASHPAAMARTADLDGRVLLPGLVNAHDHLDAATLPSLAGGAYTNAREWTAALASHEADETIQAAVAVPLADRLFLGGLRNLLAGVTAVLHHGAFHRSLGRAGFPVRVQERYEFASSAASATPEALRRTYRTTDRRIPWIVHAAEGTDERAGADLDRLAAANVLRQNTVIIHGIALPAARLRDVAAAEACVVWSPEANQRVYGATADVRALRAAGVRVGLGGESPVCGGRDALSNLAAARREAVIGEAELLALATRAAAEVARLPAGAVEPGAAADLVAVESIDALLSGARTAIALVLVAGEPRYGEDALMSQVDPRSARWSVDGAVRRLGGALAPRAASLWRRHRAASSADWMRGVEPLDRA
jgi:cytosine/adenosine deaminase-related metal-dependent hydrolase